MGQGGSRVGRLCVSGSKHSLLQRAQFRFEGVSKRCSFIHLAGAWAVLKGPPLGSRGHPVKVTWSRPGGDPPCLRVAGPQRPGVRCEEYHHEEDKGARSQPCILCFVSDGKMWK